MFAVAGCQATRPDVGSAVERATGIRQAIVFHDWGEPLDASGGAPADARTPLTLEQLVRESILHDARVQSALAKVRVAEADANQARLLPNPVLSLDVRYPTFSGGNHVFEPALSQDLLQILQKPAQITAADDRLRGAASDALTTVLDVIAEAQSAYASNIEIDAEIKAGEERIAALEKVRDVARARFEAGDVPKLDVTTLESQVLQAQLDQADLGLRRTELRLKLAKLLGQPQRAGEIALQAPAGVDGVVRELPQEEAWVAAGLSRRPELQAKLWELAALGEDLTLAQYAVFQGTAIGVHAERDPKWRVGPTLSVPLPVFDWGQQAKAKAEAQRVVARHDLLELQRQTVQEIRLAHATYVQAQGSLDVARKRLLPLQRAQLEQAQLSYKLGETDLSTTLLAQGDYAAAIIRVAKLEESASLARIRLERAVGGSAIAGEMIDKRGAAATRLAPATIPQAKEGGR